MAFNVSEVRAEIAKNGIMKLNQFMMTFSIPLSLNGTTAANQMQTTAGNLQLYCEGASIPGVGHMMEEVRRYGYGVNEKRPYMPAFTDLNLTFRGDANASVWNFFTNWMRCSIQYQSQLDFNTPNGPVQTQTAYEIGYKYDPSNNEGYATDCLLTVFNDVGDEILHIMFLEAFPIFVGDVALNWGTRSDYARIPVTMSYFDWFCPDITVNNTGN